MLTGFKKWVMRGVFIISLITMADTLFRGIKLIYLALESPDLNPIEECLYWIKHYIRRNGQEFHRICEGDNKAAPYVFLYNAMNQITAKASQGWFSHSGYM